MERAFEFRGPSWTPNRYPPPARAPWVGLLTAIARAGHEAAIRARPRVGLSKADQRAAGTLAGRMPALPDGLVNPNASALPSPPALDEDASPYQRIAADLRGAIACGALPPGQPLPPVAELADRYGVAFGAAQRAITQLREAGLITVSRGCRAVVADNAQAADRG